MTPSSPSPFHRSCVLQDGVLRFADRTVLTDLTLSIGPTEHLAVIGDNGAGKSSLLQVLAGRLELSAGHRDVVQPGGIALAEQRPDFTPGMTVSGALDHLLREVRELEHRIGRLSEALATSAEQETPRLLAELGDAMELFDSRDGHGLQQRVDTALEQLGLGHLDPGQPVDQLSGGEQARLALAAALSAEAELLLLDEPTNDLDDNGLHWLEGRLRNQRGAVVIVTHDRALLETFATGILAIEEGRARRYGDGYVGYLAARAAERQRLLQEHEAWSRDLRRHEALLEANSFRLHAIPRKREKPGFGHGAFRGRSRDHGTMGRIRNARQRIAELHDRPAPRPAEALHFSPGFVGASSSGGPDATDPDLLLATDAVVLSAPPLRLGWLAVRAGQRWLITGANGAGKTTLLRVLAGELSPEQGRLWRRPGLRVAWLRQDLRPGGSVPLAAAFASATGDYPEDAADRLLSLGLFHPADLHRPLGELSVGQRRRLEVAVAVTVPSDVLLLDEPTNHLSPELVEQLEAALVDYPGTVLTVTHDRRWRQKAGPARRIRVAPGGQVGVD